MTDYLYGFNGDERLQNDPATVYELWADDHDYDPTNMLMADWGRPESLEIERWTVSDAIELLPPSWRVLEWLEEMVCDDIGFEEAAEALHRAVTDHEVVAGMDEVRTLISRHFTGWKMADNLDGRHIVTWDDQGDPLLDGEPMYTKTKETP